MTQRTHIPVLALLGLSFTGCPDEEERPDPIIGEWLAIQRDGGKLPELHKFEDYTYVSGIDLTVEDDLAGQLGYYEVIDYGEFEYQHHTRTDLVVDASGAPTYRLELVTDLFDGDDGYDSAAEPDLPYDSETGGNYFDDDRPTRELAAPSRPQAAPAALVLTCTLDQDVLSCAADEGEPKSLVFKRKAPVEPSSD